MGLPNPNTLHLQQLDVTENATLRVGRVDLGKDELVTNGLVVLSLPGDWVSNFKPFITFGNERAIKFTTFT
jgi:hypothetical protein